MFGSLKKKSNESNPEILVKKNKNPIWNFFKNHETDKSKAVLKIKYIHLPLHLAVGKLFI
jgi:hypothetical protein